MNFDKSAIYFSPNVISDRSQEISYIVNIPVVACHERYLGLPTVIGRRKKEYFDSVKSRV